jgi:hypothetical protein
MSGSGGAPDDACTHGAPCVGDDRCVVQKEGWCCLDVLVCENGRYAMGGSECGTTACPETIPEAGTACGPCAAICPYDTCTRDGGGKNLGADCTGEEWVVVDLGCLACCSDDSDCESNFCVQGRCLSRDHGIGCFRDDECAEGEVCAGTHLCPCGSPAGCKGDGWGECVPDDLGCCLLDADCDSNETCVEGVCKAEVGDGSCWKNDDCEYGCGGVDVCDCGSPCSNDVPGQCWVPL